MNQYTRYLTIAVLVLQAPTYLINLAHTLPASAFVSRWYLFSGILCYYSYGRYDVYYVAGRKNY